MAKKKADTEVGEVESGVELDGHGHLPGMAPIVVKEIVDTVLDIENNLKVKFGKARDALTAKQDKLSELAHTHIEHFSTPDEKGTRIYKVPVDAGNVVVVKITFDKEKIVTAIEKPKNPTV